MVVFFGILIFLTIVRIFKYEPDIDWQFWVLFLELQFVVLHDMVKYGV